MTVTTCTPLRARGAVGPSGLAACTASELSTTARVAVSVFPSPVFISAIWPSCSAMPPISWTSKWRIPIVRLPVSRTIAKHSGQQVVEGLVLGRARAQLVHPLAQLGVGIVFELALEGADQRHAALVGLELLRLADVQRAIEQGGHAPRIASPLPRRRRTRYRRPSARGAPAPRRSRRAVRAQTDGCDRARRAPRRGPAGRQGVRLAAVAQFVAVALDLARELVDHRLSE